MRVTIVNASVCSVDDDRSAESGIQRLTEPQAYLIWSGLQDRIFGGIRSEQNSMRFTCARQEKCQAECKEDSDRKTTPRQDQTHMRYHGLYPISTQALTLLL